MKILIIGLLVFFSWSALATHLYVCGIKGLCNDREAVQVSPVYIKEVLTSDSLPNTLAAESGVLSENFKIYFAFDKSEFISNAQIVSYFDKSITYLLKNMESTVSITGYTDAVGSDEYNQALGYRRASGVQRYFTAKGIASGKIEIISKGEKEPEGDNNTAEGRTENRRTSISIKN